MENAKNLQGDFEFGEDPSGIWIFDAEIEKLRAKAAFPGSKDQNHAWLSGVTTNRAFKVNHGALQFQLLRMPFSNLNAR